MSQFGKLGVSHSPAGAGVPGGWHGLVVMSERELQRVEVLSQVVAGRLTVTAAAGLLGIGRRPHVVGAARQRGAENAPAP
jgi:hypothetical protein